jgi:HTH-type transcriptional regulator / antitoxin HigA
MVHTAKRNSHRFGSRNRVYEVLNRRRALTLKMIWRLHDGLGIPAESLIILDIASVRQAAAG